MALLYYHRPTLVEQLARDLLGDNPFSDAPNGLFLAAPRRTGKSAFLQHDLKPELERRGCLVVYVDFWAQSRRDPAQVLMEAIALKIQSLQGLGAQLASALSKIKLAGLEIDLSRVGQSDGTSIPQVLELLRREADRTLVLILDEAQHALTTEAGESAMFALKSARDQMNSPAERRLLMVFSGSDRDKLLRLLNSANAPFYGSQIHHMPELERPYVERVADALEKVNSWLRPVNVEALYQAFLTVGRRPQFLNHVLEAVLRGPKTDAAHAARDILAGALEVEQQEMRERRQLYLGLKPLEQYVLWRMLEQGPAYRPYDADSKAFYSALLKRKVSTAMTQNALASLRDHNVVWKSARAEYAVEDTGMQGWFAQEHGAGRWPPNEDREALLGRLPKNPKILT
jgi:hypothetical protein